MIRIPIYKSIYLYVHLIHPIQKGIESRYKERYPYDQVVILFDHYQLRTIIQMPPKITILKVDRPKRKYTKKEKEVATPEEPELIEEQEETPFKKAAAATTTIVSSVHHPPAKVISLDQVTFGIKESPMDVYLYFAIEPLGKDFTKYQFYGSRYDSLYDHLLCCNNGSTPPPDYSYYHAIYTESQAIHPMITLHIKIFYVNARDYTWKVCTDNLAKAERDRSEYGYHYCQFRMLHSPETSQKLAVKRVMESGETQYIQLPPVSLDSFRDKAAAELKAIERGIKKISIS